MYLSQLRLVLFSSCRAFEVLQRKTQQVRLCCFIQEAFLPLDHHSDGLFIVEHELLLREIRMIVI